MEKIGITKQGQQNRAVFLHPKTLKAEIGCFYGTFDAAREAIKRKYGEDSTKVTGGYGLTLLAMDAIEKEYEEQHKPQEATIKSLQKKVEELTREVEALRGAQVVFRNKTYRIQD